MASPRQHIAAETQPSVMEKELRAAAIRVAGNPAAGKTLNELIGEATGAFECAGDIRSTAGPHPDGNSDGPHLAGFALCEGFGEEDFADQARAVVWLASKAQPPKRAEKSSPFWYATSQDRTIRGRAAERYVVRGWCLAEGGVDSCGDPGWRFASRSTEAEYASPGRKEGSSRSGYDRDRPAFRLTWTPPSFPTGSTKLQFA